MSTYVPPKRKTYTYAEFHAKTGKDHSGYNKYLKYVHNVRSAIDTKAASVDHSLDAFAPVAPKQGLAEARQAGLAAFNPAINQENAAYDASTQRIGDTITNYTKGLAAFLPTATADANQNFQSVQAGIAASNAALTGAAQGQGQQSQQALSDYLAKIGAPAESQQYATNAGALGTSIGTGIAARGQAAYEGAATRQGSMADLMSMLPTIAANQGSRTLRDELANLTSTHQKTVGGYRDSLAKAIQDNYATFKQNELSKASALATLQRYGNTDATRAAIAAGNNRTKITTAKTAAETKKEVATIQAQGAAAIAAAKAGQIDVAASKAAKPPHMIDHNGNPILDAKGRWIPVDAAAKASDVVKIKTEALKSARITANQWANQWKTVTKPGKKYPGGFQDPPVKTKVRTHSFDEVVAAVESVVGPQLASIGYDESAIHQVGVHWARIALGGTG